MGNDCLIARGNFDYDSGGVALKERMQLTDRKLDALICANDLMAIGAIDSARINFGIEVPGDLSVVGFDGVGPATWLAYQVTTIRQPVRRMTEVPLQCCMSGSNDPSFRLSSFCSPENCCLEARLGSADDGNGYSAVWQ